MAAFKRSRGAGGCHARGRDCHRMCDVRLQSATSPRRSGASARPLRSPRRKAAAPAAACRPASAARSARRRRRPVATAMPSSGSRPTTRAGRPVRASRRRPRADQTFNAIDRARRRVDERARCSPATDRTRGRGRRSSSPARREVERRLVLRQLVRVGDGRASPGGCWRTARQRASSSARSASTIASPPSAASSSVSDGRRCRGRRSRSFATSSMSPVSSPASICMIVMPVSASPASIARWIGAAPRQRGSRLAWMLRQPRGGIDEHGRRQDQPVGRDDHRVVRRRREQRVRRAGVGVVAAVEPQAERLRDRRCRGARASALTGTRLNPEAATRRAGRAASARARPRGRRRSARRARGAANSRRAGEDELQQRGASIAASIARLVARRACACGS